MKDWTSAAFSSWGAVAQDRALDARALGQQGAQVAAPAIEFLDLGPVGAVFFGIARLVALMPEPDDDNAEPVDYILADTDSIAIVDRGGLWLGLVEWEDLFAVYGERVEPFGEGVWPLRWVVHGFPTDEELAAMNLRPPPEAGQLLGPGVGV